VRRTFRKGLEEDTEKEESLEEDDEREEKREVAGILDEYGCRVRGSSYHYAMRRRARAVAVPLGRIDHS